LTTGCRHGTGHAGVQGPRSRTIGTRDGTHCFTEKSRGIRPSPRPCLARLSSPTSIRNGRGEGKERDGTREVSKVQGRRSEARNLDPWTLDRGTLDQRRDGTGCFIEKSSTNVCGGKKLADGSGHFVSLGTGPTLSSPRSKVTESPGGRSSLRSRSTRRRTGTGHDVLSRKASE
jgi:hypothetical protein